MRKKGWKKIFMLNYITNVKDLFCIKKEKSNFTKIHLSIAQIIVYKCVLSKKVL